jgi:hypothetical protein
MTLPPLEVIPAKSEFELIVEQDSGEPVFRYKGKLWVGKLVRSFEI